MRRALTAAFLALLPAAQARAGWVQAPGAFYAKLWDRSLMGRKVFGLDGAKPELADGYQDHALNLYVETGATRELTLVLKSQPVGFAAVGEASTIYSGLTAVGLRVALLHGELPLALELSYGYTPPLGAKPLAQGTVGGVPWVFQPSIEQHLGRVEVQAGWATGPLWARGALGAIYSSAEGIDPALEVQLALGARAAFGLGAALSAVAHTPARRPNLIDVTGTGNTRYLGVTLEVSWWWSEHLGVNAGFGTAPSAASNAATPALSLGLEIRS